MRILSLAKASVEGSGFPAAMASSADLEAWRALGGTVKEQKSRKRYIAPSGAPHGNSHSRPSCLRSFLRDQGALPTVGESYQSWAAASKYLEAKDAGAHHGGPLMRSFRATVCETVASW